MEMNHYDTIADLFNTVWHFSDEYKEFVHSHIMADLALTSTDTLVDIGGGTGIFTSRLAHEADLQCAYCIEPSPAMCDEASKLDNIRAICTDASGFCTLNLPYTKLLLKEVIHHIRDREEFWKNIHHQLPPTGKLLIITRPQHIAFPFFDAAKEAFAANQPPHDVLVSELQKGGFSVETQCRSHTFTLPKQQWYLMLRHRFMSDLSHFSDQEIEEGIDEIEKKYPENHLTIVDNLIFITATKGLLVKG